MSTECLDHINKEKIIDTESTQDIWELYASVRTKPRRILNDKEDENVVYFPISRQPLCVHPEIQSLGREAQRYILVQSLYKYMNDIANIETDIINRVTHNMTKDKYHVKFSMGVKQEALSIIIDESYHAYVALDFMLQVQEQTKIKALDLPTETELSLAIKEIKALLSAEDANNFELMSVCIAEHVLTNDLISVANSKEVCKTFYNVMHDHAMDEGRHAKFFASLLSKFWDSLSDTQKKATGIYLPELMIRYLQSTLQKEFDTLILTELSISKDKMDKIIQDTHPPIVIEEARSTNLLIKQILKLLNNSKILEHTHTREKFKEYGLINETS